MKEINVYIVLSGKPGTGKTQALHAVRELFQARGWTIEERKRKIPLPSREHTDKYRIKKP